MEYKFSPGPWRYCHQEHEGCICGQIWSITMDNPVATAEYEWDELGMKIPVEMMKANALLIATAPEMLEALQNIAKGQSGELKGQYISRVTMLAKEIIQKATKEFKPIVVVDEINETRVVVIDQIKT